MRPLFAPAIALVLLASCDSQPANPAASATPTPGSAQKLTGTYGLVLTGLDTTKTRSLQLIGADGNVAASVAVAPPSLVPQACGQGAAAWTQAPVSATDDAVYFRDGDTKIRMVVPPSSAVDVTTVPGGPHVVSFFSVSPDNARIAVLVEDLTAAPAIGVRLYVEDLHGGSHHQDIDSAELRDGRSGTTEWPMGWHQGRLVLAIWAACTFEAVPYPTQWQIVDSATGQRWAAIGNGYCILAVWPSPAGVACFDTRPPGHIYLYNWDDTLLRSLTTDTAATEVSPSGELLAVGNGGGLGNPSPATTMLKVDGSGVVNVAGHMACLWIDESHVLATDAVIAYPSAAVNALPQSGQCAGRFPGGL